MNIFFRYAIPVVLIISMAIRCAPSTRNREIIPESQDWQRIGPGGGGATFIPTFSYHSSNQYLLRCDMTGSYLTKDGGESYRQINFANGASSFAFDPGDSNRIYIGSSVLNQSTDGGLNWKTLFPASEDIISGFYYGDHANYHLMTTPGSLYDSSSGTIGNIRVDPVSGASVYFSMGRYFFWTKDPGQHWKRLDCDQPIQLIYTNDGDLVNEVMIFTSHAQWTFDKRTGLMTKKELPVAMTPAFSFSCGTTAGEKKLMLYALQQDPSKPVDNEFGSTGLWTSSDKGNHWQSILNPEIINQQSGIKPSYSMIACSEMDAGQAYLITNRYLQKSDSGFKFWYGALKTNDGGQHWQWVWKGGGGSGQYGVKDGLGVANLTDAWVEKAFGGEYIRLMDVGVSPQNGNIAVVTDWYRSMKTIDGGMHWSEVYSKKQPDGTFISRGLDVTTCYGVHFDPFDSNHIVTSYTDIGYHQSWNRGKSWQRSVEGVPAEWTNTCYWVVFDPSIKNKVWSCWSGMHDFPRGKMTRDPHWKESARGGICVSLDGGRSWQPSNKGMGMDAPVTSLVLDNKSLPGNRTLFAAAYNKGVFKSTDDGKSWTEKNKGIEETGGSFELTITSQGHLFLVVSATPAHPNGQRGREFHSGAVYRSVDDGETWTRLQVAPGLLFPNGLEYDPSIPGRLLLGCWAGIELSDLAGGDLVRKTGGNEKLSMPGGVFMSEDDGNHWQQVFDEKQYVYDVTADSLHKGRFYINTFNRAAYRSDDGGRSWKKIKGYDFHWGHRVIIDHNDPEKIFLTSFGSGLWHGSPLTE